MLLISDTLFLYAYFLLLAKLEAKVRVLSTINFLELSVLGRNRQLVYPLMLPSRRGGWWVTWGMRVVLQTLAPGKEDAEPVSLVPVGLPCLERGRLKKPNNLCLSESDIITRGWFLEYPKYSFYTRCCNLNENIATSRYSDGRLEPPITS